MPVTPADVRNVTFNKPPLGRPGYHEDEVDDFLDLVEAELARLIQQNAELRTQVGQLDQQLAAMPADITADPEAPRPARPGITPVRPLVTAQRCLDADHGLRAAQVLIVAQGRADQLTDEAHAKADQILSQARTDCQLLLTTAQDKAEDLISEARARAETILQDARTTSQILQQQSQDGAALLEQDATRKRTEILAALHRDKTLLETTIGELWAFELEYRTQLATYLHTLLYQLDGPLSSAPTDFVRNQPDLGPDTRSQASPAPSPSRRAE